MANERDLIHHGVITAGRGFGGSNIYWLRLWKQDRSHIAVVTEVPGNPGLSIVNGISLIVAFLDQEFGVTASAMLLFEIWPPHSLGNEEAEHTRVDFTPSASWRDVSLADIETAVGGPLPPIPLHDELFPTVLAAGGGIRDPIYERIWAAIPVTELPFPHNPSSCRYIERFKRIKAELDDGNGEGDWEQRSREAGRRFIESLTARDCRKCEYHKANWKLIADESVRIIEENRNDDMDAYLDAAQASSLRRRDKHWLGSLFFHPIDLGENSYVNGQHRGCALRFSGAERAAVIVDFRDTGEDRPAWRYVGGG